MNMLTKYRKEFVSFKRIQKQKNIENGNSFQIFGTTECWFEVSI